jgi:uncharacterized protein (DUF2062 family)
VRANDEVTAVVLATMAVGILIAYWPVTLVILALVLAWVVIRRQKRKHAGQNATAARKIEG